MRTHGATTSTRADGFRRVERITEDTIADLARFRDLDVIARNLTVACMAPLRPLPGHGADLLYP
jgi:TolB-like protein